MFFYLYSYWWSYIIILPGIIFAIWAQVRVSSAFSKYSQVSARSGWTASDLSRMLLEKNGCAVTVQPVQGKLTDNYNALMGAIVKAKPAAAKGQYIKSCVVASTMGPGVKMSTAKL